MKKSVRDAKELEEVEHEPLSIPNPGQPTPDNATTSSAAKHTRKGLEVTDEVDEVSASAPLRTSIPNPHPSIQNNYQDVAPGAVAVDVQGRETNPMASQVDDETLTFVSSSPPLIIPSATLVQEPSQRYKPPTDGFAAHATPTPTSSPRTEEHEKNGRTGTRNRPPFVWIAVALIIAVAAIVVAIIVTRSSGEDSSNVTSAPTFSSSSPPSPAPVSARTASPTDVSEEFGDGQWVQDGSDLVGDNEDDWFGGGLSLSSDGRRLAASAVSTTVVGSGAGYVRSYELSLTTGEWVPLGTDQIGNRGVALSGNGQRLATCQATGDDVCVVRIFEWDGGDSNEWLQLDTIEGLGTSELWGTQTLCFSYDGSRLAIGTRSMDQVHVFEYNGQSAGWDLLGEPILGESGGDNFGWSVALSGDGRRLVVGARNNDNDSGVDAGHARVYEWLGSGWGLLGDDIDGESPEEWCGYSVSLSSDGRRVAVGSFFSGEGAGTVRIFEWDGSDRWVKVGQSIDGNAPGDYFGVTVAISANGLVVVVGATEEANGHSGYVEVHYFDGSQWVMAGNTIQGDGEFGGYVTVSSDGRKFVAGARARLSSVLDVQHVEGYAKVYEWTERT